MMIVRQLIVRQNFLAILSMFVFFMLFDESVAANNNVTITNDAANNVTIAKDTSNSAVIDTHDDPAAPKVGHGQTNLPLQDVNILILTNFHSWVGGHKLQRPDRNADYGDILSFYQRLKGLCGNGRDLWFVMNGNFVHGSVIGGQNSLLASSGILEHIPYDLVTIGDQELQSLETLKFLRQPGGLFDWWGPKLLTSNILLSSTNQKPLGTYYQYLKGGSSTVLAFGFAGEMDNVNKLLGPQLFLQKAENAIELPWFKDVLQQRDFDVILVLAHLDRRVEQKILQKIRKICGNDMVIQFVNSHNNTHGFEKLDSYAPSMETGRLLNTLGFMSFDKTTKRFNHTFINTTEKYFGDIISEANYMTEDGIALRNFINRTETAAGGNEILGCSPKRFRTGALLTDDDSLLRLYLQNIMPYGLSQMYKKSSRYDSILLQNIESFVRNDLPPGIITMNDLWGIIPHDDTIKKLTRPLRGDVLENLGKLWSKGETALNGTTPTHTYAADADVRPRSTYELFALSGEASQLREILTWQKVNPLLDELVEQNGSPIMVRDVW
eukprot:CAMPEP_0178894760 /NCGR_PEP_ID=MMETSP0786-20121207/199_1 /TAXON_ID=186022 /ORGANISM="Thalassionema frauenfeldii, Strain CCMP 1798" /LENGTH=551 /DNA_ID=CAMNT_0020564893 /DNA_START=80 /DNA_END=1732 /DNA_ORIENTATION=+